MGLIGGIAGVAPPQARTARYPEPDNRIHQSVFDRMQEAPGQQPYIPKALFGGKPLSAESHPGIQPWGGF